MNIRIPMAVALGAAGLGGGFVAGGIAADRELRTTGFAPEGFDAGTRDTLVSGAGSGAVAAMTGMFLLTQRPQGVIGTVLSAVGLLTLGAAGGALLGNWMRVPRADD